MNPVLQIRPILVRLGDEHGAQAVRPDVHNSAGVGIVQDALQVAAHLVDGGPEPGDAGVVPEVLLIVRVRPAHGDVAVPVGVVPDADVLGVPLGYPAPAQRDVLALAHLLVPRA